MLLVKQHVIIDILGAIIVTEIALLIMTLLLRNSKQLFYAR